MTKMFEEYWRGMVSEAVQYFKSRPPRGEFTLVLEGQKEDGTQKWTEERLQRATGNELKSEKSAKEISAELAKQSGWSKKEVYALINQNK
jgi:16S rRNA (cytidine1402-2'-O)-methyltransferase